MGTNRASEFAGQGALRPMLEERMEQRRYDRRLSFTLSNQFA